MKNNQLYMIFIAAIIAAILVFLYVYTGITKESFVADDLIVYTCPNNMNQYTALNGDELCCDGDVDGRKCRGKTVCAISSTNAAIPSCAVYKKEYLQKQSVKHCPSSMPNYYENSTAKGCTVGALNKTAEAPLYSSDPYCIVYDKIEDALKDKKSCYLEQRLEKMYVPKDNHGKTILKYGDVYYPISYYFTGNKLTSCADKEAYSHVVKYKKIDPALVDSYACESIK